MGVYKNTTYFSGDFGNILPVESVRMSPIATNVTTKKKVTYVEKKSNRVEVGTFDAIRFRFDAIRFRFDAIKKF